MITMMIQQRLMIVTLRHMEGMVLQALMGVMEEEIVEAIVVVMPDAAAEMKVTTVEEMAAAAERMEEAEVAIKSLLVTSIAA
jgi:hypothetical protein